MQYTALFCFQRASVNLIYSWFLIDDLCDSHLDALNLFWSTQNKCDILQTLTLECNTLLCFVFREPESLSPYSYFSAPWAPHDLVQLYSHLVHWSAPFGEVSVCTFTHLLQWRQFAHFVQKNIWCTGVNLHIWSSTNLHSSPMHGPSVADFLFVSGSKFLQHARNVCEACKKHFQCWHRNWHCFHNLHIAMYWYIVIHKM